tara:strand:+ start:2762 stop:4903 length:2142 start_codon:yes stop_codon:yes gene_type:complete
MTNLSILLRKIYISKYLFYLLVVLIILSFSITFYLLLPNNELVKDPQTLQYLLLADVILVLILASIILRQILLIFIYRKKNIDESRLYIKFINLFTAMALGPAIGMLVITSFFYSVELSTLYGSAFRGAVINSNIVARDYQNEIQSQLVSDTQLIMREIIKVSSNNKVESKSIEGALREFINVRTISNIYLFNRKGEVFISFEDEKIQNFSLPNEFIFSQLDNNQTYIFQQNQNSISAYKKVNFLNDIFIQVNRNLKENILSHIKDTRQYYEIYTSRENESGSIQIKFSMIYILFSICFILIAILIGFNLARRLSQPISNLIESANQISKGDFNAKVSEQDQFDEIKILLSSYNKMIDEIKNKQNELLYKSEADETKRIFIEAVLSLLTIGVISLDKDFNINLFNQSTLKILNKKSNQIQNKNFLVAFPEWAQIFKNFQNSKRIIENFQIEVIIDDNTRNLNLRIIKEVKENVLSGYVVTIDDMTSLILAEKHGAWSDIAKKIAHEVKNPLTPIKLSAERIEKKSKDKTINYDDIKNLTQTISKQVDDIGKLVDEFSSFARMPEPEIKLENLSNTLKESFDLFANAHSNINMKLLLNDKDIFFQFDKFQISQVFNNVIKNAIEAVKNIPNPWIKVSLSEKDKLIIFNVSDNGVGVDEKKISKLFEPYYTTKDKGTGLGLSIVKKIVEDHGGKIKIEKNKNMTGATNLITFEVQ